MTYIVQPLFSNAQYCSPGFIHHIRSYSIQYKHTLIMMRYFDIVQSQNHQVHRIKPLCIVIIVYQSFWESVCLISSLLLWWSLLSTPEYQFVVSQTLWALLSCCKVSMVAVQLHCAKSGSTPAASLAVCSWWLLTSTPWLLLPSVVSHRCSASTGCTLFGRAHQRRCLLPQHPMGHRTTGPVPTESAILFF